MKQNSSRRLLVVTAHPDDESFGPSGTIAHYAARGVQVQVVCATRGEVGDDSIVKSQISKQDNNIALHTIREQELLSAAKILGVRKVEFLDFIDGTLNNQQYHLVAEKIIEKFAEFEPQVVLTYEPHGVSGHLDHVAMSFITTYAYMRSSIPQKLYYYCLPTEYTTAMEDFTNEYFVYFPPGYPQSAITTRIDIQHVLEQKITAMRQHKSQQSDVDDLLAQMDKRKSAVDHYILCDARVAVKSRETDLFAGIA